MRKLLAAFLTSTIVSLSAAAYAEDTLQMLNVSYDPTREFYEAYNREFTQYWKSKTGKDIKINQSHGGSGKQARAIMDGLNADVATLALAYDIDVIAERGKLLEPDWQTKFPHNSAPCDSAIVFLVHKDNPKHIHDWDDLVKDGVQVLTPNPKTSGGARWNYLAAWGYAYKKNNNNEEAAKAFIAQLFKHVPLLDTGARGATTSFTKRGIGDVLITWESEALLITNKLAKGQYEVVTPSISILAEPPVAVITKNAQKNGTEAAAHEYLEHLYTKDSQELMAKFYYRPSDPAVLAEHSDIFPKISLLTIEEMGGWKTVQQKHFVDGGTFDQVYAK
ncbi:MAG TPA: sulfate ABC transporter substrate-binding protein [Rickettsiales bacterium]|nr:sulfate ABC transporter substrate-binding protein [Rickettsiales bacterium]